jgi:hypothetical protein
MKVSSESSLTDRILVYSWVLVSDFRPYSEALHKKINEIPGTADSAVGFIYIDHEAGISLKIEHLCRNQLSPGNEESLIPLEELASLRFRYNTLKTLSLKLLSTECIQRLGLAPVPEWVRHYNPPDLQIIREFTWLDQFRAPGFFDDVMAILPGKDQEVPEIVWVRLFRYFPDTNWFKGILLNEPFRDYGIHRNDTVNVQTVGKPEEMSLIASRCETSQKENVIDTQKDKYSNSEDTP